MAKIAIPNARRGTVFHVAPEELGVVTDPAHFLFDTRVNETLAEEWLQSLDAFGVRQAILGWRHEGKVLVVDGRKRVLGAWEVNRRRALSHETPGVGGGLAWRYAGDPLTVKVELVEGTEAELKALMILTNEARHEDRPLNKANKTKDYVDLLTKIGDNHLSAFAEAKRRAALVFGVTVKTVEARLKLLDLAPPVQAAVEAEKIGFWAATELATLPPEKQAAKLEALVEASQNGGRKPSIEDAKVAAGKGEAPKRKASADARQALCAAALACYEAFQDGKPTKATKQALWEAAMGYGYAKSGGTSRGGLSATASRHGARAGAVARSPSTRTSSTSSSSRAAASRFVAHRAPKATTSTSGHCSA